MSEKINNQPHQPSQENLDYQHALEVMEEARIAALGALAFEAADSITFEKGVMLPVLMDVEADAIAKEAAIPGQVEEYLKGGVAAEAQKYLKKHDEEEKESEQNRQLIKEGRLREVIDKYREDSSFLAHRKIHTKGSR